MTVHTAQKEVDPTVYKATCAVLKQIGLRLKKDGILNTSRK